MKKQFPVFACPRGGKIAINPAYVACVVDTSSSGNIRTDIHLTYADSPARVANSFEYVVKALEEASQ